MKKIIYSILLLSFVIQSCKKDSNRIPTEQESFYPIGTVLKISDNIIVNGKPTDTTTINNKINRKTSYFPNDPEPTIEQPYFSGQYAPYALGTYGAWRGPGLPNVTIAKSSNISYRLVFQTDGNLVLYKWAGNVALWSSGMQTATNVSFQSDGNFVMTYNLGSGEIVSWSAGVLAGPNPIWVLQDDGNFVGYSNHTNNGNGSITITGSPFGSTGTTGGKKSSRNGKIN